MCSFPSKSGQKESQRKKRKKKVEESQRKKRKKKVEESQRKKEKESQRKKNLGFFQFKFIFNILE